MLLLSFLGPLFAETNKTHQKSVAEEIDVGVILDMGSWEGRILQSCISMAISDFHNIHGYSKTRIVIHNRDSKAEPLRALSSVVDLLQNFKVRAIIGGQTSMEAKFLAELGNKIKIPIISLSASTTTSSLHKYPYSVQISQDEFSEATSISAIVEEFKWRDVIIVHQDIDDWTYFIPHLVDALQEKNIHIAYKSSFATSYNDIQITEELHRLKAFQQRVFIVHLSPSLTSRFFKTAKKLGMIAKGYVWIMTLNSMDHLNLAGSSSSSSSVTDSMQGVIGLKSYIPASDELHNFTSRLRMKLFLSEHNMKAYDIELSAFCIRAYDVAWGLAEAVDKVSPKISLSRKPNNKLTLMDLDNITTSTGGSMLLKEIFQLKFRGLSGHFQFINGKLISINAFEIVNVIGKGYRRLGFWTSVGKFTRELYSSDPGRHLSSTTNHNLEDIIWPGGSAAIPKGYDTKMSGKMLRIAVPRNVGFPELVNVDRNPQTNKTIISGFCIDVFKTVITMLEDYEVDYKFIPFVNDNGENEGSYSELIDHIYLQDFDAAVGDISITENRSLYVDFTLPYSDLGVGMVARKERKNHMWIFLEPLTTDLWLSSASFFILTGIVIWLIEHPINNEFQGSISQQIGTIFWFSFSTLVFAHRERLISNLSRFVVIVWVFVVLILTSSYTATLTSMITVQQINLQLNSKESYIGYQRGSQDVVSNLNFSDTNLQPYTSPEDYANALSRGSKKGGVSAIVDEIPYIKIFLSKYSADYSMVGSDSTTNGFAFVFRKGSPLVPEMSRAIAKLRADGRLSMMENAWFKGQSMMTFGATSNNVNPLTIDSFRGLFLITGVSSTFAIAILYSFWIYNNWHFVRNCFNVMDFNLGRLQFIKEYLYRKMFRTTNVIELEQIT
ncbi:hypothetical protein EZV62_020947 [Acer yangbiense]|uniref:Glutamate receptor n=1 Tax=Acer yangbiense TaxID=1000413 RepID=A0A5C7HFG9_9ROSI|nr:hypothetical protein EZV62_020947 [Acer yangbiense]